jgi:hypothetical protein
MKRIAMLAGALVIAGGTGAAVAVSAYASSPPPPSGHGRPFAGPGAPPGEMLYGESVGKDDKGAIERHDFQNGQVTAVSGGSVTVRSSDGTSWTWTLNGSTKVVKDSGSASEVKTGDKVMVSGLRDGGTRTASLVVDPPPDFGKLRERLTDLPRHLPGRLPG